MMAFYSRRDKDDDYNAWVTKGNSLSQLERHEEAIECYDKAIRIDPENYDAWFNKGNSLVKLERHEEAIECYDKAIRIDPEDYDTWLNKGNSLAELERHKEAIECYDEAIRLDSENYYAWRYKGYSLAKLERHEESKKSKFSLKRNKKYTKLTKFYTKSDWVKNKVEFKRKSKLLLALGIIINIFSFQICLMSFSFTSGISDSGIRFGVQFGIFIMWFLIIIIGSILISRGANQVAKYPTLVNSD